MSRIDEYEERVISIDSARIANASLCCSLSIKDRIEEPTHSLKQRRIWLRDITAEDRPRNGDGFEFGGEGAEKEQ